MIIEWPDFKFPPINLWVMPPWKYVNNEMSGEDIELWQLNARINCNEEECNVNV